MAIRIFLKVVLALTRRAWRWTEGLFNAEERVLYQYETLLRRSAPQELLKQHNQSPLQFRSSSKKQRYQNLLAGAYENVGNYQAALEVLLETQSPDSANLRSWEHLLALEAKADTTAVYDLFREHKDRLPALSRHYLQCVYSGIHKEVLPDWTAALAVSQRKYNATYINSLINAAFIRDEAWVLHEVEAQLLRELTPLNKPLRLRSFRQLSAVYYKSGDLQRSIALGKALDYKDISLKLNISLGSRDPVPALNIRSELLASSFLRAYKQKSRRDGVKTLFPEKDLCGDVFLPFFYRAEYEKHGTFRAICDERMLSIHQRSFPYLSFIPKTSARKRALQPDMFKNISPRLANFIDRPTRDALKDSAFFRIDSTEHFDSIYCQENRHSGWLIPCPERVNYWQSYIDNLDTKYVIGFCSGSTVSTPNRDIHMVPLEYWAAIFNLSDTTFINLNAAFSEEQCQHLSDTYSAKVITPAFDLYNDFENLLALMSCLDYAIVPSNNMMDMAASVGTDTIVLSPTGIMSGWIPPGEDKYVFSKHVYFITRENSDQTKPGMVTKAVERIERKLTPPNEVGDTTSNTY
ncbi:hypothetical protein QKW35_01490 [Pontibacterium granulatum]|uniref:hypothetical protein n=1 Tax=Pontibacterium granulatum TaxID=2036029 RepID=UPI00249CF0E2|nr:hypothetical protein [Pontibacterium granulatum]MDI3323036.1 hypothetical protein [Pontibacterium granulatum]